MSHTAIKRAFASYVLKGTKHKTTLPISNAEHRGNVNACATRHQPTTDANCSLADATGRSYCEAPA